MVEREIATIDVERVRQIAKLIIKMLTDNQIVFNGAELLIAMQLVIEHSKHFAKSAKEGY